MSKLLLYCTKAKPYLVKVDDNEFDITNDIYDNRIQWDKKPISNGKVVAECDFEVEKIRKGWGCLNGTRYFRNNVNHYYPDYELEKQSCLSFDEIDKYLKGTLNENCGYAIHIKNLHIFDEPRELCEYDYYQKYNRLEPITKAPQNMMRVYSSENIDENYILISIKPEWLCKILNGEQTIIVRKRVLKEMLNNE